MKRAMLILSIAAPMAAQQVESPAALPPETLLLARIRLQMTENLQRQPNYTCLETVERTLRPKGGRAQVQDTLRLEVALVDGKEMFAWPGSKVFEDKDLRDLVATGTFGNGNFAIHARAVFMSQAPVFTSRGQELLNGRPAVRYDFRVPRISSGYTLRVNKKEGIVGYRGSFWADPQTLDVRRLEVFSEEIPKELEVDWTSDRVDYARVPIGGTRFLLPVESVLEMAVHNIESRNFTRFSACRQYTGESVLKFTEEIPEDAPVAPAVEPVALPKGAGLVLALTQSLELRGLAVGDLIAAELKGDLKYNKQVLAPKGALAAGRITRLEWHPDHAVIGVAFTELEWKEQDQVKQAPIRGSLSSVTGIYFSAGVDTRRWPVYEPQPGEGIVRLPASHRQISRGTLFHWRVDP
jgi:hypothetical protein